MSSSHKPQWKSSHDLPAYKRLKLHFDIVKLREACREAEQKFGYDGYSLQADLVREHAPGASGAEFRRDLSDLSYVTMSLTEFDESYSLSQRVEKSGSVWDRYVFKKNPRLDERFYRRCRAGMPDYFRYVMASLPGTHRVRLAKLHAGRATERHVDYDTLYSVRFLIPIFTAKGCTNSTLLPDGSVETIEIPADGGCVFTNQGLLHWAENQSREDRIFLAVSADSQRVLDL